MTKQPNADPTSANDANEAGDAAIDKQTGRASAMTQKMRQVLHDSITASDAAIRKIANRF